MQAPIADWAFQHTRIPTKNRKQQQWFSSEFGSKDNQWWQQALRTTGLLKHLTNFENHNHNKR